MPHPVDCIVHNLGERYQLIWCFFLALPLNSSKTVSDTFALDLCDTQKNEFVCSLTCELSGPFGE